MTYPFPTPVDLTEGTATSNTTTFTLNKPASVIQGSFMLATIYTKRSSTSGLAPTTVPSGWTAIITDTEPSNGCAWGIYYKAAGASEPASYAWGSTSASLWIGSIIVFDGVDTSDPLGIVAGRAASTTQNYNRQIGPLEEKNSIVINALLKITWGAYSYAPVGSLYQISDKLVGSGKDAIRGHVFYSLSTGRNTTATNSYTIATNTEVSGYIGYGLAFELRGITKRNLRVRSGGVWRSANPYFVRDGNLWKEPEQLMVRDANIWKEVYA